MENEIKIPDILLAQQFKLNLEDLCRKALSSGLPAYQLRGIVFEALKALEELESKELAVANAKYKEQLEKQNSSN